MPFYPGPGLGGHCIPLDPFYLTWKAAELGLWARFIELAGEVNTTMPSYVVARLTEALNDQGQSLRGASVLVLGLSYKPDIDDDRESPSFRLIELMRRGGALVSYCDPFIPIVRRGRVYDLGIASVPCSVDEFARYDALLISTAHSQFKDPGLYAKAKLVVDTRNLLRAASQRTESRCEHEASAQAGNISFLESATASTIQRTMDAASPSSNVAVGPALDRCKSLAARASGCLTGRRLQVDRLLDEQVGGATSARRSPGRRRIVLRLLRKLRQLVEDPAAEPILRFADYVSATTHNALDDYSRRRDPCGGA